MAPGFLGIDIGTSKTAVVIIDREGKTIASESKAHGADIPAGPGLSEQDPARLLESARSAVAALPAKAREAVAAVGVTGQMHGVLLLDAKGEPVGPLVTWQDGRCSEAGFLEGLRSRTGMQLRTGFGCATLAWYAAHCQAAIRGHGSGNHPRLDRCPAVRHGPTRDRSHGRCELGTVRSRGAGLGPSRGTRRGIPGRASSPGRSLRGGHRLRLCLSGCFFRHSRRRARDRGHRRQPGFPARDPDRSRKGACPHPGHGRPAFRRALGRCLGSHLGSRAGKRTERGRCHVGVPSLSRGRLLAASASLCGGSAWLWLAETVERALDDLGLPRPPRDKLFPLLNELGTRSPRPQASGLSVNPHFLGERHDPARRAAIEGITLDNLSLGSLARSLAEGICVNLRDMLPPHLRDGRTRVVASGNALERNPLLRQAAAEALGLPLVMSAPPEAAAVGAAINAGRSHSP